MSQRLIPTGERSGIADAHRGDGKRYVVRADEKLTAFLELEAATRKNQIFIRSSSLILASGKRSNGGSAGRFEYPISSYVAPRTSFSGGS